MTDKERIAELERKLAEAEAKANRFQADYILEQQKNKTLKHEIGSALKLDYNDFEKSKNDEYSDDLFAIYRIFLKRIYKTLKKYGIDFDLT